MEIEKAKELKREVEKKILGMLRHFADTTGLRIRSAKATTKDEVGKLKLPSHFFIKVEFPDEYYEETKKIKK